MNPTAKVSDQDNRSGSVLYMAFELGSTKWELVSTSATTDRKPRRRRVPAGDIARVSGEIEEAKRRFGLPREATVRSVYEAGRDGFWVDRWLRSQGVENIVVDSASIEVNRRARRTKTDRLDALKLLSMLVRFHGGERSLWAVVRVPSPEEEDARRLTRELERLTSERSQHVTRIKSLLASTGVRPESLQRAAVDFDSVVNPCGEKLLPHLRRELEREWHRLTLVRKQIREIEAEQGAMLERCESATVKKVRTLARLRGIGPRSSWLLVLEFFAWREFSNRRQVGSLAGLTASPYASDAGAREQGISKAGNQRVRSLMCEIAWGWLRYQPRSKLSRWFNQTFGPGTKRLRRVGIVALARKLLIALWRYVEFGIVPEGAIVA